MRSIKQNISAVILGVLVTVMIVSLNSCGGSGTTSTTGSSSSSSPGSTTGSTVSTTTLSGLKMSLTNSSGASVTSVSSATPTTVSATVLDATGAPVPNAVVTFTTDATLATMTPTSGTALTNASGVATITLLAVGTTAGATTISATAQVSGSALTNSLGYAVGAATVTVTTPTFGIGAASLSAFGTTSITVTVSSGGTPVATAQTVTFTSACASSGKAVLGSVVTVSGVAIGSYRDNGCASTDTVVASVGGGLASSSASLTILAPSVGSIQYVSAVPTNIALQGSGGATNSLVTFKVVDSGGNPISGQTVTFGLSTTAGGITLASTTGISASDGTVVAKVNSGTISTPVRVTATTPSATLGVTLTSQSSQLSISTGIPSNSDFSISATKLNIEGWNYDGNTTVITAILADHFKNPVPDGTTVSFTSNAGSIADTLTGKIGSCSTVNGTCSATLTTSGTRPSLAGHAGRVTVLAYAVGEESFTDINGNGLADLAAVNLSGAAVLATGTSALGNWPPSALPSAASAMTAANEMFDVNYNSTDLPDPWIDANENGIYDVGETFFDFNHNSSYQPADGKYSGSLCNESAASLPSSTGTCAAAKQVYVRDSIVITFSDHNPVITPVIAAGTSAVAFATGSNYIKIVDQNGNALPVGTTISFAVVAGTGTGVLTSGIGFVVPNTDGCYKGAALTGITPCTVPSGSPTFGDYAVDVSGTGSTLNVTVSTLAPVIQTTVKSFSF
jgi:hypothetical protein